jgi:hypothetical protein
MKVPALRWKAARLSRPIPERGEYKGKGWSKTIVVPKNHSGFRFFDIENTREAEHLRHRNINGIMAQIDLQQQLQIVGPCVNGE